MDWLTASTWSPYAAGAGIGVLSWLTLLVSGHPIGCSTSFARTAGMIEKLFRGQQVEMKPFYREIPPVVDWQWMLVAGMVFGAFLFVLWEVITIGCGVPMVLLPAPSQIAARFAGSLPILGEDFVQTVLRAVIPGWLIGSAAGFLVALIADRIPFLGRGLIPLGNFVSALPMVGIAPIMVMWFGFDWQSKAAVVVINTFFPMLVNTVAGLAASGRMERDLMRSWNASWAQTLLALRLPAAMPHVFGALKLNSTFALIAAIVAEYFGTPIVGMGFRISTEVGRMGLDMVWAEIAVAAITGSTFYMVLALIEKRVTFWHPSNRGR